MKGLSIEEKAKAYDEAISMAKKFYTPDSNNVNLKATLEMIFPELAESEDEKIRKHLIEVVELYYGNTDEQEKKDCLDWLEKQNLVIEMKTPEESLGIDSDTYGKVVGECVYGEQKSAENAKSMFKAGDWLVENEPNNYACFVHILEVVDVQGKEKYRIFRDLHNDEDLVECRFIENNYHSFNPAETSNICEFSIKTWIKIVDYVLTEHNGIGNYLIDPEVKDTAEKLQKKYKFDAASEEWDRVYRKGLDAGVNKGRAEALREQKPSEDRYMEGYLNGINDASKTQKPTAWSEEDEETIDYLIDYLESELDSSYTDLDKETFTKEINLLKSLRPKSQWKPSDEQMDILWDAIVYVEGCNSNFKGGGSVLENLYSDLKKLRGE